MGTSGFFLSYILEDKCGNDAHACAAFPFIFNMSKVVRPQIPCQHVLCLVMVDPFLPRPLIHVCAGSGECVRSWYQILFRKRKRDAWCHAKSTVLSIFSARQAQLFRLCLPLQRRSPAMISCKRSCALGRMKSLAPWFGSQRNFNDRHHILF